VQGTGRGRVLSCPYEILGVDKNATQEEIQKQYRTLARKYHPDVSKEDDCAEKFKKVAAAYEMLSDPQKRAEYDRFGSAGGPRGFGFGRKPFTNPFDDFVASFFHRGGPRQQRGRNIVTDCKVTLEQVLHGEEVDIGYNKPTLCEKCNGEGTKCPDCEGSGFRVIQGPNMTVRTSCNVCEGTGKTQSSCEHCNDGFSGSKRARVKFKVPPGVETGMRFAFRGQGAPALGGGVPGDLFVVIEVQKHKFLDRLGSDLLCKVPVSYTQLVFGADIDVPSLEGVVSVKVPAGSDAGQKLRLANQGLPIFSRDESIYTKRGDLLVQLELEVPTNLEGRYLELINELAEIEKENSTPNIKAFAEKLGE
jgi:molecular chaperone DnaJ